jgi:hypothetical protein
LWKAAKQVSYRESGETDSNQVGSSSHGHPNLPEKNTKNWSSLQDFGGKAKMVETIKKIHTLVGGQCKN